MGIHLSQLKTCVAVLLLSAAAFAQNSRVDNVALGPRGPIPAATVAVCQQPANTATQPCSPLANLCSTLSDAVCTQPNPVTADSLGNYHFYVKQSQNPFTVQIYGPQVAAPLILPDQSVGAGFGTSNTFTAPQAVVNAGVFTNTQMNLYDTSFLNGFNPAFMWHTIYNPSWNATDALSGGAIVPNTASSTNFEANGVSGYVYNFGLAPSSALNGLALAGATSAPIWGATLVTFDQGFATTREYPLELACYVANIASECHGALITAFWSGGIQPTVSEALEVSPPGGAVANPVWSYGLKLDTGATATVGANNAGILFDPVATGNSQNSQGMQFDSTDGGGVVRVGAMYQIPSGDLEYLSLNTPNAGFLLPNLKYLEGVAPVGVAAQDVCYGDSTAHTVKCSYNNGSFFNTTQTIGSGTSTTNGTGINTLTCQAQPTITVTGATTSDVAQCSLNTALPATWQTGIVLSTPEVTTNTVTYRLCNPTATATITPAATAVRCTVTR